MEVVSFRWRVCTDIFGIGRVGEVIKANHMDLVLPIESLDVDSQRVLLQIT